MASYPTTEEITSAPGWDMEAEVKALPEWRTTPITLAELNISEDLSSEVLFAWAYLTEALCAAHPAAKVSGFKVIRPLTWDELTKAAISTAAGREYTKRQEAEKATKSDAK